MSNPQSRNEAIIQATIDGTPYTDPPKSRIESLLLQLKKAIEEGGGGTGTTNYENLTNKPQINGEELVGNKTSEDIGIEVATEEEVRKIAEEIMGEEAIATDEEVDDVIDNLDDL